MNSETFDYNASSMYTAAMLAAWLQQQDNVIKKGIPSWTVLQTALWKIGENELADEITT